MPTWRFLSGGPCDILNIWVHALMFCHSIHIYLSWCVVMHEHCSYNTTLRATYSQVKNHGIPEAIISNIMRIAREFFRLPESERLKNYSDDPSKTTRLSTSFNVKTEKVSNWRDFLRFHCFPLEDYVHEWPSNPPSFRWVRAGIHFCSGVFC